MIRTTPFHARTESANTTGLWSHWAATLTAEKYQISEKAEYFAVRNAVGLFDTSPLYKYRVAGRHAERFLAGVLARDIRQCRAGQAQYTVWCDDQGFVIEDGVVLRHSDDEFLLTAARPNLSYFRRLIGYEDVEIADVSDDYGALAVQGPRSRAVLATLSPDIEALPYFGVTHTKIGAVPAVVSRTGFTGDLGYEVWVHRDDALAAWDEIVGAGAAHGAMPIGQLALLMARIEAGLVLIDIDFQSSRYAFNDDHKSTPAELGLGWMFRNVERSDRQFIGRSAVLGQRVDGALRRRLVGLVMDWRRHDQLYTSGGLIPPKDHRPYHEETMVYDDDRLRVGYATSSMYSPMLQRQVALAHVRPGLAIEGTRLNVEVTINHRYEMVPAEVTRLPFYNPERKTT